MALEDYKDLISTCATITTIAQFLTGITVCQKFIKSGTTGESSSAPFVRIHLLIILSNFLINSHVQPRYPN